MSSIFRRNKVEEKTVINNIIQKKTINQIDYQTISIKAGNTARDRYLVPLPINSILKAVNVEASEDQPSTFSKLALQVEVKLVTNNSNIKVSHQLMRGIIYNSLVNAEAVYNQTLSGIYDLPIQKEGMALEFIFYNYTGSSYQVNINTMVENLEGGI